MSRRDQSLAWIHKNAERVSWTLLVITTGLIGWTLGLDAGASTYHLGEPVIGAGTSGVFGERVGARSRWLELMRGTVRLSVMTIAVASVYASLILLTDDPSQGRR